MPFNYYSEDELKKEYSKQKRRAHEASREQARARTILLEVKSRLTDQLEVAEGDKVRVDHTTDPLLPTTDEHDGKEFFIYEIDFEVDDGEVKEWVHLCEPVDGEMPELPYDHHIDTRYRTTAIEVIDDA